MNFLALDFETANYYRDSACALGLVRIENNKIVDRTSFLIRPPYKYFVFTYIHGITWEDVENEPTFEQYWKSIKPFFEELILRWRITRFLIAMSCVHVVKDIKL